MCCKRSNLKFDVMQSVSFAAIWPCRSMLDLLCGLFAAFSVACMSFQITACCCHLTGPQAHNTHQMSLIMVQAIQQSRNIQPQFWHQIHQQRVIITQTYLKKHKICEPSLVRYNFFMQAKQYLQSLTYIYICLFPTFLILS